MARSDAAAARTRVLCNLGGLVMKAGLEKLGTDAPETLLGALIDIHDIAEKNPAALAAWREMGLAEMRKKLGGRDA